MAFIKLDKDIGELMVIRYYIVGTPHKLLSTMGFLEWKI